MISIVSFIIIQLPPGDFLTSYVTQLSSMGDQVDESAIQALRDRYGLGQPLYVQYFRWMDNMLHGDFGHSMEWNMPVSGSADGAAPAHLRLGARHVAFYLGRRVPDRDLLGGQASTRLATTSRPSSASSGWRSPTSCWR